MDPKGSRPSKSANKNQNSIPNGKLNTNRTSSSGQRGRELSNQAQLSSLASQSSSHPSESANSSNNQSKNPTLSIKGNSRNSTHLSNGTRRSSTNTTSHQPSPNLTTEGENNTNQTLLQLQSLLPLLERLKTGEQDKTIIDSILLPTTKSLLENLLVLKNGCQSISGSVQFVAEMRQLTTKFISSIINSMGEVRGQESELVEGFRKEIEEMEKEEEKRREKEEEVVRPARIEKAVANQGPRAEGESEAAWNTVTARNQSKSRGEKKEESKEYWIACSKTPATKSEEGQVRDSKVLIRLDDSSLCKDHKSKPIIHSTKVQSRMNAFAREKGLQVSFIESTTTPTGYSLKPNPASEATHLADFMKLDHKDSVEGMGIKAIEKNVEPIHRVVSLQVVQGQRMLSEDSIKKNIELGTGIEVGDSSSQSSQLEGIERVK